MRNPVELKIREIEMELTNRIRNKYLANPKLIKEDGLNKFMLPSTLYKILHGTNKRIPLKTLLHVFEDEKDKWETEIQNFREEVFNKELNELKLKYNIV